MRNSISILRRKFHSEGKVAEVSDWTWAHPGMALYPTGVLGDQQSLGCEMLEKEKKRSLLV